MDLTPEREAEALKRRSDEDLLTLARLPARR